MVEQSLLYGDSQIVYRVFFVTNERQRIAIHVHLDGSVQVDAPAHTSLAKIKQAVSRRAHWLTVQLDRIHEQQKHVLPREYISGESHLYLGRRYLLKVKKSTQKVPGVKLRSGQLQVTSALTDRETVKSLLWHWYQAHASNVFEKRFNNLCQALRWLETPPPWKFLPMKQQWGSCSPKGVVKLNSHLIKAPTDCIDYVLLHELCHLKHHNHGPAFYQLLRAHMPHWEAVKCRLDGMAASLLNE